MKILAPGNQPHLESIGKQLAVLQAPMYYAWQIKETQYRIVVPAGFVFDGASIPRIFWSILGLTPRGVMDGPALLHDFIYHYQGQLPKGSFHSNSGLSWVECSEEISRELADELLSELCKHFKVASGFKIWLVWSAVRIGGWAAWATNDRERKAAIIASIFEENNYV